jgi:hypothetical protein
MEANDHFFERPILNNPYLRPVRHWELDGAGSADAKDHRNSAASGVHHADSKAESQAHLHSQSNRRVRQHLPRLTSTLFSLETVSPKCLA